MVLGKLEIHMQQNEIKPLSLSMQKTKLKMDQGLRDKTRDPASNRRKSRPNLHHVGLGPNFLNKIPLVQELSQQSINGMDSN